MANGKIKVEVITYDPEQVKKKIMEQDVHIKKVYEEIAAIIEDKARVLDLGCGNGDLLGMLMDKRDIYGLGIDINTDAVLNCIKRGVSVIQEDIDEGLAQYKDKSYDFVVLSETLQAVQRPDYVIQQIVRIAQKAIVSFPNFAHRSVRTKFFLTGSMPKTEALPYEWYNTPNIRHLTIKDFKSFCKQNDIKILQEIYFEKKGHRLRHCFGLENYFAEEAIFVIQKGLFI
jgi:homoserine O-acetyltransferase